MRRETIKTENAPMPIGPYGQAIIAGDLIFVSGQIGTDPRSGKLAEGVAAQTKRALANVSAILAAGGAGLCDAVKTEVFLADMNDFAAANAAYVECFSKKPYPARQCVESPHLPKGALVEVSCVALKPQTYGY